MHCYSSDCWLSGVRPPPGRWTTATDLHALELPQLQGRVRLGYATLAAPGLRRRPQRSSGVSVLGDYYFGGRYVARRRQFGIPRDHRCVRPRFEARHLGRLAPATPATGLVSVERQASASRRPAGRPPATDAVPYVGFGYSSTSLKGVVGASFIPTSA